MKKLYSSVSWFWTSACNHIIVSFKLNSTDFNNFLNSPLINPTQLQDCKKMLPNPRSFFVNRNKENMLKKLTKSLFCNNRTWTDSNRSRWFYESDQTWPSNSIIQTSGITGNFSFDQLEHISSFQTIFINRLFTINSTRLDSLQVSIDGRLYIATKSDFPGAKKSTFFYRN